jgi:hypothetical protein
VPIDRTKNVYWVQERKSCAKGSFRIKANPTTLVRMCCPKGKWRRGKCVGGMRLQAIGYKKTPAFGTPAWVGLGQSEISDVVSATGHSTKEDVRSSLLTRKEAAEDTIAYGDKYEKAEARRRLRGAKAGLKLLDSGKSRFGKFAGVSQEADDE